MVDTNGHGRSARLLRSNTTSGVRTAWSTPARSCASHSETIRVRRFSSGRAVVAIPASARCFRLGNSLAHGISDGGTCAHGSSTSMVGLRICTSSAVPMLPKSLLVCQESAESWPMSLGSIGRTLRLQCRCWSRGECWCLGRIATGRIREVSSS